jgi:hypothetical protein
MKVDSLAIISTSINYASYDKEPKSILGDEAIWAVLQNIIAITYILIKTVTLNLFQGLTFSTAQESKMLKQVQHDDLT